MSTQSRWQELADQVRHHRQLYYYGEPEISDADFDALLQELKDLEPVSYTHLTLPTNREV